VSSEMIIIGMYSCPHCRAELETGSSDWQGWQRCPSCGLPSLPPEPATPRADQPSATWPTLNDDVMVISDSPEGLTAASSVGPVVDSRSSHISPARLVFRTGLLVSLGLAFIFFLDHRTTNMVIFLALAFGFFLLLIRNSGRRSAES
jgi:hypothetical protein